MSLIYHYTTAETLYGMLSNFSPENPNFSFWASHCLFLNDPKERKVGEELCYQYIGEIEEELGIPLERRFSHFIKENLRVKELVYKRSFGVEALKNNVSNYIISFSEAKDSLPMWNMYSKNGNGIALGFEKEQFRELTNKATGFTNCLYDIDESELERNEFKERMKLWYKECLEVEDQIGLRQKFENRINKEINNNQPIPKDQILEFKSSLNINKGVLGINETINLNLSTVLFTQLLHCICTGIKDASYKYEKESRLIIQENCDAKFRHSNGLLIPYVEKYIPVSYLKEIIIGPMLDKERSKIAIAKFLNYKGIEFDTNSIIESQVPYRG